jgi:two-component system, chemotaxis family, protein-glutamate methylesterase/glutaminase
MQSKGRNIVAVGTSAGGLEALDEVVGQLPADIPASIFIVQHLAPEGSGGPLLERLSRHKAFRSKLAIHGERFEPGRIYIAPSDHHLLIKKETLLVTKGARENRNRPGIDPLFRSAAVNHGPHVIGVVLTGMLDDGTAGLMAIGKCGGVTVVQDPDEAAYPGMAQSALANLQVDHCVRLAEMGPLLDRLAREPARKNKPVPEDVKTEAIIAERVLSDISAVNGLGDLVPYNCPNCGGVLWNMKASGTQRFRCHTGHSFTAATLLASQSEKIEETLWIALRMFEERRNLLNTMASKTSARGTSTHARAREAKVHIERIRAILLAPGMAESKSGTGAVKRVSANGGKRRVSPTGS